MNMLRPPLATSQGRKPNTGVEMGKRATDIRERLSPFAESRGAPAALHYAAPVSIAGTWAERNYIVQGAHASRGTHHAARTRRSNDWVIFQPGRLGAKVGRTP